MSQLEEIRERLDLCDKKIVSVLEERMDIIKEIMVYKKENGLPILQPEQEKRQRKMLLTHVDENTYKDEILDIFTYIVENSRRIQAKTLFTHNILLIGFMGAGKSTVSTYLSKILASPQVEMDEEIVKKEGMSINKIFEEYGETYFRNCETNLLIELQKKNNQIISCGGGVALRDENVAEMKKNGKVVLLTASPEVILERVKDNDDRPLLRGNKNTEFISNMMEQRRGSKSRGIGRIEKICPDRFLCGRDRRRDRCEVNKRCRLISNIQVLPLFMGRWRMSECMDLPSIHQQESFLEKRHRSRQENLRKA